MKTLYIECAMGAAGDMLVAALADLLDNPEMFLSELRAMNIPNVEAKLFADKKCGVSGKHFSVAISGEHEHEEHSHHHSTLSDITDCVSRLNTDDDIKKNIVSIYNIIAEAESKVHGTPVYEVHFHEVGFLDAVADVAAACLLMKMLAPERVVVSPICVGSGTVKCAHGILPVPAPATAEILKGVPIYDGDIKSELCTPTGAAILKFFADEFSKLPPLTVEKIGYGTGNKDFKRANCVRALLGKSSCDLLVSELCANVDDMTGEEIAFAVEQMLKNGALDAWTEAIGMKKSRPGFKICVLCRAEEKEEFISLLFRYTKTIGIRETLCRRSILERREELVENELGTVRKKISEGFGIKREKLEYEDIALIASNLDMSLEDVKRSFSE